MKKKMLITGIAGFIGSHLLDKLLKEGCDVYGIDNLATGSLDNIAMKDVQFIKGDIKMIEEYTFIDGENGLPVDKFDVVYHLAATATVKCSVDYPLETNKNNVDGVLKVLEWAKGKAKRLVFASSSSVYGGQDFKLTEDLKCYPQSPYALQKLIGEEYCRLYSELYGLDTVSLRFFNVYGSRMNPNSEYARLIPRHIMLANRGEILPVNGSGEQKRSFVYVDDVVNGLWMAGVSSRDRFDGEVYNLGYSKGASVKEVDKTIEEVLGKRLAEVYLPAQPGEAMYSLADISKAERQFGWEPKVSLLEGITRIIKEY